MNRRFLSSSGGDAVDKLESFEHVLRIVRELADASDQVLPDVLRVVEESR